MILRVLELRGVIIIEDNWINNTATYYFSANQSWLIAAVITLLAVLGTLGGVVGHRRAGLALRPGTGDREGRRSRLAKLRHRRHLQPRDEADRVPGGHASQRHVHQVRRLPLAGLLMVIFLVV